MHDTKRDAAFRSLIQAMKRCEKCATDLGLDFLPKLLSAAQIEAAIQWGGGTKALEDPDLRYEGLIEMKVRLALSTDEGGVLPVFRD